jgi:alkylation response protein AidB-like acyl-CoA dehydrogenase
MRFAFTEEQQTFRRDVCQFLSQTLTPEVIAAHYDPNEARGYDWDFCLAFRKQLAQHGYVGIGWPSQYGGAGKDMVYQLILAEEMEYHRAPGMDGTLTYIPSAIMAYGSEEQKQRYIPRIATGEVTFFLGYSEPEAGSDLAALRMQAEVDGDDFLLTGEKAFSSEAQHADYGWVAARTDPNAPKHRGISLFIVDMQSPGISMGGFTTMSGWHHPTVSFDHVRVPKAELVGEVNRGWYYIMGAIDFERAALGNPGMALHAFDRLVHHCKTTQRHGKPLLDDPLVQQRLAELYTDVEAVRLLSYWVGSMHARDLQPQHETSLSVLAKRETVRALDTYGTELLGSSGQLRRGDPLAPQDGGILHDYLDRMYFSFAAGGFDITRNVLATRGLGLPRG